MLALDILMLYAATESKIEIIGIKHELAIFRYEFVIEKSNFDSFILSCNALRTKVK